MLVNEDGVAVSKGTFNDVLTNASAYAFICRVCLCVTCGYLCANDFNKNVEKSEALNLPAVFVSSPLKIKTNNRFA